VIERLEAGERWDGDNAEVLRALGWAILPNDVCKDPEGWAHAETPQPLNSVDDALRLVPDDFYPEIARRTDGSWAVAMWNGDDRRVYVTEHLAVALTIAILRAHSTVGDT